MRILKFLALAAVAGLAYWAYKERLTVSDVVDRVTSPVMSSKAAVKESEYNRVVSEAVPAAHEGEDVRLTTLHNGMKMDEVRDLLGRPDRIETIEEDGRPRVRWTYRRAGRVLVFDRDRVVSVAIR
jgi:hypothetical protein